MTVPSPLVVNEQVKLEIVPGMLEQGTPNMLAVISAEQKHRTAQRKDKAKGAQDCIARTHY